MRARRGRRWRGWLALLAVLVALRLALPIFLGPMIEARLSHVLGADVDVGDVSFAPIDAVLTLHDVTVRAPRGTADAGDDTPVIVASRVRIDVQWLPLLHRELLVRELAIESGRIDLEHFDGTAASLESWLHADPATELPPGWSFALDRIVLRDTQLRLQRLGDGDAAPLQIAVRDAQIATLRRRASVFGRAPNLRVDALVEGGRIRIDGTSDLRDDGLLIDTLVRVKDVPLARLQPWVAGFGWTGVAGRVSGQLHYQRDPGRRDLLTGQLQARRIAVQVPALGEPAFAVRRAVAEIDGIDLLQRRVTVGALTLHGARLAVRPDLAAALPLLDGVAFAPAAPDGKPRRTSPATPAVRAVPWSWIVGRLATPFARLYVDAGDAGTLVVPANVSGESLGPGAYWSPLRARIGGGEGSVGFDGTLRLTHGLTIDGRLTANGVDAPAIARALDLPLAELAQSGLAAADLTIEIEPGATKEPPLDVRGHVTLTDVWLAGPDADEFALGAGAIDLNLAGIDVGRGSGQTFAPSRVRFSDVAVSAPYALFTRTADGWLLPPFAPESADVDGEGAASEEGAGDAVQAAAAPPTPHAIATAAASADAAAHETTPRTEVVVAGVRTSRGRVLVVDDTTVPATTFDLALIEGWAQDLRLPQGTLGSFVAQGSDPRFGVLQLGGARSADRREVDISAQAVPLAAASPYLEQLGLPYRFTGGTGSFLSHVAFAGDRWSADTTLTLREARVTGDEVQLQQSLGMQPDAALAALRDPDGDVTLRLPLASVSSDDPRALPEMVAGAVRAAVSRARQTPLPVAPLQIDFAAGRSELAAQAARQIAAIAEVLRARRDVVVELSGTLSSADRRWLAEQELVDDIDEPGGFMGVLRALGVRGQRERIRDALQERGAGRPGSLDADDEAVVDELIAQGPPIADDRLAALAAARLTRVTSALTAEHGIAVARVLTADPVGPVTATTPAVRARIGVDPRAPDLTSRAVQP